MKYELLHWSKNNAAKHKLRLELFYFRKEMNVPNWILRNKLSEWTHYAYCMYTCSSIFVVDKEKCCKNVK